MERLLFLSRHHPTMAQIEMAKQLGFNGIKLKKVIFPDTKAKLEKMIDKTFIPDKIVALAAPTWIHFSFWEKGIATVEFTQHGEKVRKDPNFTGAFLCKGIWVFRPGIFYKPHEWKVTITPEYIPCKMSIEEQATYLGFPDKDKGGDAIENQVGRSKR